MNLSTLKAIAAAAALSIGTAHAASASYVLDASYAFPAGVDYGTVQLTQDGSNVDVDVQLSPGFEFVKTGGPHDAFTFNIAGATGYTVTDVDSNKYSWLHSASNPGMGSFSDGLWCASCSKGGKGAFASDLSFIVTGVTLADFTMNPAGENGGGYYFTADIIDRSSGNTGAVGALDQTVAVPEPANGALMLAALAGMGLVAVRRRQV